MRTPFRALLRLLILPVAILSLSLGSSEARADDTPIRDPILLPGGDPGGGPPPPTIVSPEMWEMYVMMMQFMYPEADYLTICALILQWYNVLPPIGG